MKKYLLALLACFALSASAWAAVDINSASQQELEKVRGIGPHKAKAIVEYRKKNGPFASVDDLAQVKGFGPKSIEKLRSELTVAAPAKKEEPKAAPAKAEPAKTEAPKK